MIANTPVSLIKSKAFTLSMIRSGEDKIEKAKYISLGDTAYAFGLQLPDVPSDHTKKASLLSFTENASFRIVEMYIMSLAVCQRSAFPQIHHQIS